MKIKLEISADETKAVKGIVRFIKKTVKKVKKAVSND